MRDDFCVFILSYRRASQVITWRTLLKAGYTGKMYLVVDDEDPTLSEYQAIFGAENVLVFSLSAARAYSDEGSNFGKRGILFARNACFDLAVQVGCKYFIELDDDYKSWLFRYGPQYQYKCSNIKNMDAVLETMLEYMLSTPAVTICMSQGGDWIGGTERPPFLRRKAMNSFICAVDRRFDFAGVLNEDVNVYTSEVRRGMLMFTVMQLQLVQKMTQTQGGGLTEVYLDAGTYVKSFYSVMYAPSCVKIGILADSQYDSQNARIHHKIDWGACAPCILREEWSKN